MLVKAAPALCLQIEITAKRTDDEDDSDIALDDITWTPDVCLPGGMGNCKHTIHFYILYTEINHVFKIATDWCNQFGMCSLCYDLRRYD